MIVVDPRRTRTAEQADLHLAPRPGTDLALALGLLHLVVAEGRVDEEYVAERTSGWEEARAAAMAHWPEYVERITGVSVPQLREAVRMFCEPETAMVLTARGPEQQSKGTDTVGAWINLCLATGRAGRPLSGYGCLTGQGNGQGGREHGQKADQLPGYRKLDDPAARRHVAEVWGVDPDSLPGPGRSAYELLDALATDIRSLLLMGVEPGGVRAARRAHRGAAASRWTSSRCATWCCRRPPRSRTSSCRSPSGPRRPARRPTWRAGCCCAGGRSPRPRASAATWRSCTNWPAGSGVEKGFPTDPEEVFEELRRASAGGPADYSGITYRRLAEENGVFWPCPAPADGLRGGRPEGYDRSTGHGAPRHPAPLPRPFRHPGRPGPVRRPSRTGRPPRSRTRSTRCC